MLKVENVTLAYDKHIVLEGINFVACEGEIVGLIGPNGSGKSTLIRAISGVLPPRSGEMRLKEKSVTKIPQKELAKLLAVVPQNPSLPETLTAFEIVLMGRNPWLGFLRHESRRDMEIAYRAMELTQTHFLAERKVGGLSGGERQRVIIARALTQEPKSLLLDEPIANLDINHQVEILNLIKGLCSQKGLTVVAALHDLNLASQFCDRLILLSSGQIHTEGMPKEVITSQNIKEVYGAEVLIQPHPINGLPTTLCNPSSDKGKLEEE